MQTEHSCHIYISGMTCIQCQNRIEAALNAASGISRVKVSYRNKDASFVYDSAEISYEDIVKIIRNLGYDASCERQNPAMRKLLISVGAIAVLYVLLEKLGLLNLLAPSQLADSGMGYGTLFIVGLLTSVHCIAMCGGINLSQTLPDRDKRKVSYGSAILYNSGRVISYTLIGLILGTVGYIIGGGAELGISLMLQGMFKIIAGVLLAIMGAQMLDIFPGLPRLSLHLPKSAAIAVGKNAAKSKRSLIVGFLNGIMPCGPLQAMWLVALVSGSPVKGALSMLLFSLGTVPLMLGFGTFVTVIGKRFTAAVQSIGAVIVTVMGLSMLSQGSSLSGMIQDNVLYAVLIGVAILAICFAVPFKRNSVKYGASFAAAAIAAGSFIFFGDIAVLNGDVEDAARIVDGVQVVTSTLQPGSYPEITVQGGIPVKWTIKADAGSINGCNQSIISNDLSFDHTFHEGENVIEFTPDRSGDYTYICWMGMIKGTIHVVDEIQKKG